MNGKSATSDIEALVAEHVGAGDVGVCMLANPDGIEELYVAVAGARLDPNELLDRVKGALRSMTVGKFYVVVLRSIPA